MYGREFMQKPGKLGVLLDSASVERYLPSSDRRSRALLKYQDSFFMFARSPEKVSNSDLQKIVTLEKNYDSDGSLHSLRIAREKSEVTYAVGYRTQDINEIGELVYKKKKLNIDEKNAIELVFIQAILNWPDSFNLLVTENEVLLENRLWFESHFLGRMLNIVTMKEAAEIIDLFSKFRGRYLISDHYTVNKGYWYWLSFRTKIPFYHVGDPILDAFAQRFVFLLMSVDQIGFEYYSGVNNDTADSTIYHLNYFISLVTGIFDSLALRVFNQYGLVFRGSNIPSRISLNNKIGGDFLRALRENCPDLRRHVHDYVHFITVIYLLRERVLHREGLKTLCFECLNPDENWKASLIKIPAEFAYYFNHFGDKKQKYDPITEFGIYKSHGETFLEPYRFVKSGALLLSRFSAEYLRLLGFSDFVEELENGKPNDDFVQTIRVFQEDNLGL